MNPYRHIKIKSQDEVLVITVLEVQIRDYQLAEELRFELVHAVKSSQRTRYVLDLRNMEFMTSLSCVAFIGLKHAVRDSGGRLVLCNMSDFIRKILTTKRLLTPSQHNGSVAFESVDDLPAALEFINS